MSCVRLPAHIYIYSLSSLEFLRICLLYFVYASGRALREVYYSLHTAEGGICVLRFLNAGTSHAQLLHSASNVGYSEVKSNIVGTIIGQATQQTKHDFCFYSQLGLSHERLTSLEPIASSPIRLPIRVPLIPLPPCPDGLRKLLEDLHRRIPIDTGVRDADALLQRGGAFGRDFLVAFVDVGFDHDADDGRFAFAELIADRLRHVRLVAVVFVRVAFEFVSRQ